MKMGSDNQQVKRVQEKLSIPCSHISLIPRPQLMEKLNSSTKHKLLFVCAPAGYGKTTTVAEWLRSRKETACWLSLNQLDNQLLHFWQNLSDAIRTLCDDKAEQFLAGESKNIVDGMSLAQTIVRGLSSLPGDCFIIFDDYQVIEQALIHEVVYCLLKIAPQFLHFVIISRCELPASFAGFYLQGQIQEVRTKDLQFQTQEISALCRKRNVAVTKTSIENLEQATEGWLAGLHFALRDAGTINEDTVLDAKDLANNKYITDYLETEVWANFTEKMQEFMLKISVLDVFTAAACEAVMQEENAGSMLELLQKHGAMLVAVTGPGNWFRYHFLYKAFLRKKLEKTYKYQLADLHRRAAVWLAQNNFLAQAIEHALQAKDYTQAADLTVEYAKDAFSRGHIHELLALFAGMPQEVIEGNCLVRLAYTWTALLAGELETYQMQLDKLAAFDFAAANVPDNIVDKVKNEMLFIRAVAAFKECNIEESLNLIQGGYGRGSIFISQSMDFNYGEASLMNRNRKIPLSKAMDLAVKMKAMWPGISPPDGAWSVFLGELLYERNELDNALYVLNEGVEMAGRSKSVSIFIIGSITMARIARAKGNLDRAFAIIAQAVEKIKQHKDNVWLRLLEAFRVWLWVNSHDREKFSGWLANYETLACVSQTQRTEYEEIARIRVLQALGRFDESIRLLQQCMIRARREKRLHSLVVMLTLQAIARQGAGDKSGALLSLNEALGIAQQNGYLRSIIDEGEPVAALLRQLLTSSLAQQEAASADFSKTLLRLLNNYLACLKHAVSSRLPSSTDGKLTRREREILFLLAAGQPNAVIAERTGVSINTVKCHIRNLYSKLGVRNRVQAVNQARNMQLL